MIPKFCGFPLWKNLKRRIALKHLRRTHFYTGIQGAQLEVGGLFQACDAFNHRLKKAIPIYHRIGHGMVLIELDLIDMEERSHSWKVCCESAWTVKDIHAYHQKYLKEVLPDAGWFNTPQDKAMLSYLEAGNLMTDEFGCKLPDLNQRIKDFLARGKNV